MPYLLLALSVIGGVGFWFWRLKRLHEAGMMVVDSAETMRGALKRWQFRKKAEGSPLGAIQEPSIAAVVFYIALANEKPLCKDAAKEVIRKRMAGYLLPAKDLEDTMVFADWACGQVTDLRDVYKRLRSNWIYGLNVRERAEMLDIAMDVARAGDEPTTAQTSVLSDLRRALQLHA